MFHVTAAANRGPISRCGLDCHRMGAAPGDCREPATGTVFVCDFLVEAGIFTQHAAGSPVDVWAVRVDGLWVENGPDGWWITTQPVSPERLRLAG